jgi:hypothetical protein
MQYRDLQPIERVDAEAALASRDPEVVCDALLRLALHDPEWEWVEEKSIEMARSELPAVRGCAATALGHLARIHRRNHYASVVAALRRLLQDPETAPRAEDALDDVRMFAGQERNGC